jgi:hypothetical protein
MRTFSLMAIYIKDRKFYMLSIHIQIMISVGLHIVVFFIGCEYWQGREKDHIRYHISNYDPITLLKLFGRNCCKVHQEILDSLGFSWMDYEAELEAGTSHSRINC